MRLIYRYQENQILSFNKRSNADCSKKNVYDNFKTIFNTSFTIVR